VCREVPGVWAAAAVVRGGGRGRQIPFGTNKYKQEKDISWPFSHHDLQERVGQKEVARWRREKKIRRQRGRKWMKTMGLKREKQSIVYGLGPWWTGDYEMLRRSGN